MKLLAQLIFGLVIFYWLVIPQFRAAQQRIDRLEQVLQVAVVR